MRRHLPHFTASVLLVLTAAGCGSGNDPAPAVSSPEAAAPALEATFQDASGETKQEMEEAVAAIQSQNDGEAYLHLESLSQKPELTPEQRQAMVEAWMAVNRRLAAAASNGDTAAEELMKRYRASK
jgi:hypothetical protein